MSGVTDTRTSKSIPTSTNASVTAPISEKDLEANISKKKGFFRSKDKAAGKDAKDDSEKAQEDKNKPKLPPVSVFQLYRFNSKLEIFLNIIGIICAVCAGAAQVRFFHTLSQR